MYFPSLCPRLLLDERERPEQFAAECLETLTCYCPLEGQSLKKSKGLWKVEGWDTRFYKHQEGVNNLTQICEYVMSEHSKMDLCVLSHFSHVQLFVSLWTKACHAPLSMGFSRQEYWSDSSCAPPGHLPSPGIEPGSLGSLAFAGRFLLLAPPGNPNRLTGVIKLKVVRWEHFLNYPGGLN